MQSPRRSRRGPRAGSGPASVAAASCASLFLSASVQKRVSRRPGRRVEGRSLKVGDAKNMTGAMRTGQGGRVDRSRLIGFSFDGRRYQGLAGDTLASALIANGVHLMGRSFKYHRPRGPLSLGSEEPNALVAVDAGKGRVTPNLRATQVEIYEGLKARSQNAWPSLEHDAMAVNGALSALFPAGFYYKTFIGPQGAWEHLYEPAIRRAAGLGVAPTGAGPRPLRLRASPLRSRGRRRRPGRARGGARRGARRRPRHPVRRAGGIRRLAARRTRRRRSTASRRRNGSPRSSRNSRRCPTSRCCRARRCSAITRRISSPPKQRVTDHLAYPDPSCRASGSGRCGRSA